MYGFSRNYFTNPIGTNGIDTHIANQRHQSKRSSISNNCMFGCIVTRQVAILKSLCETSRILLRILYGAENKPATEAKCTIDPPPRLAICNKATFVPLITAVALILMIFSSNSSALSLVKFACINITYHPLA